MKKRHLDLPDTRAAYARLSLLPRAAEFGLELDPADTAPFTVRWNTTKKRAEVLFRETLLGYLEEYWDQEPDVMRSGIVVRAEFPADKDFALLRAVANAVALTDRIGRMERDEKARKKKGYITTNAENFLAAVPGGLRTIIGATAEERDFSFRPSARHDEYHCKLKHGKGTVSFTLKTRDDGIMVEKEDYLSVGPKVAEMTDLLTRGLARWERSFAPEAFTRDLEAAAALPSVDTESVMLAFQDLPLAPEAFRPLRLGTEDRGLTLRYEDRASFSLFHNGLWVCEAYFDRWHQTSSRFSRRHNLVEPWAPETDGRTVNAAIQKMAELMIIRALGRTPEDYPALDPAVLGAAVDNTDLGYRF